MKTFDLGIVNDSLLFDVAVADADCCRCLVSTVSNPMEQSKT